MIAANELYTKLVEGRYSIDDMCKIYHKRSTTLRNILYDAYGKSHILEITKQISIERLKKAMTGTKRGPRDPKVIEKIRQSNIEAWKNNDEMKEKSRQNMIKYCAPKNQTESAKLKRVESRKKNNTEWHTDDVKLKISKSWQNRIVSESTKCKMRKSAINRISEAKFNGGQIIPSYNPSSIPIIEQKAKELGITDLQHAENGGEFYIKELGYWVDGYSAEKNIVIEYDESHHKYRVEKDQRRQKKITEHLNCEFIRISE